MCVCVCVCVCVCFVISSTFIINCYDYFKSGQRDAEVEWLENSLSTQQLNEYLFRIGKDKAAK